MYLVMVIDKKQKIRVPTIGGQIDFEIEINWAKGMIGAMPVFDNYEDAETYACGNKIIEVEGA